MGEINCRVTLPVPSKVVCVDVQGVAGCRLLLIVQVKIAQRGAVVKLNNEALGSCQLIIH